jgi:hypothetical protein
MAKTDHCPVAQLQCTAAALVELLAQHPPDLLTDGRELAAEIDRLLPEAQAAIVAEPGWWS